MGLLFGMMDGLTSGIIGFVLSGGLFGLMMSLFIRYQTKKFSKMEREISHDQEVIKSGPANHFAGAEAVGGWLYLTADGLTFVPHHFNLQKQRVSLSLNDIASVSTRRTWGIIPNGLSVQLTDSAQHKFVVNRPADWVTTINQAIVFRA